MKTKVVLSVLVLVAVSCLLSAVSCLAAVPSLINYQGVLKDSLGVPQNGNFSMKFSIYNDSIGGNKLWEEIHMAVEVKHGLFNVLLGSSSDKGPIPDSVFASPNAWLEVQVFGNVLAPRRRIVSVGYAYRASEADTAEYARFAPDLDWQVDTSGFNVFRLTGNVGIGTANPTAKLEVVGDINTTSGGNLNISGNGSISGDASVGGRLAIWASPLAPLNVRGGYNSYAGLGYVSSIFDNVTGANEIVMRASGNGTYIYGFFRLWGNADYNRFGFGMSDGTTAYEYLTIKPGGNVGIGTISPAYKLDVEGYVQAHGYYTGDIIFQKDKEKLWRMFEDEEGLYLENLKTGKVYRFVLQEVEKK